MTSFTSSIVLQQIDRVNEYVLFHALVPGFHVDHEYQLMEEPISRKIAIVTSFPFTRQTLFPVRLYLFLK